MEGAAPRILFRGGGLLAVDKPAGLPSTGRDLDDPDCLQSALIASLGRMVWAVHQLDAGTSGVILFTEKKSLVADVARRLRHPGTRKTYLAISAGSPSFDARTIDAPIGVLDDAEKGARGRGAPRPPARARSRPRSGVTPQRAPAGSGSAGASSLALCETPRLGVVATGRPARSRVRVLERGVDASLVEVVITTGRTHQVRIHLASLGHPVVGDALYGGASTEPAGDLLDAPDRDRFGRARRHALHAARLVLGGNPRLTFHAPLPDDFGRLARALGLDPARADPARPERRGAP